MPESANTRLITEANLNTRLLGRGWANVLDFLEPGRVEGVTDDRPAFEAARLTGRPVYAPTGNYYLSKSPDWGSGAVFRGDGKRKTIIKLLDNAPADVTLWGNASLNGTVQMYFSDFTLDGNCQRQGGTLQPAGGSRSSCMTFRNVQHAYVDRVEAINPLLHGFDVTRGALDYPYLGDGVVATMRSSNIYFDQCESTNFGDDAFTCHSSDYIHYSRCIGYDPRNRDNNNGFEIDGDSRHITLTNNRSYGCYAGIEVKGHENESAAQEIIINGHHDTGSVRSYNFRHIGFHSDTDPLSTTARNIIATNLVSIDPNNDKNFQDTATPRALAISAFKGVSITGFTAIGRGGYGAGCVAISIQFKASHINLSGINVSGWTGADSDLSITSGDYVTVTGFTTRESAPRAIYTGSNISAVNFFGVNATAPTTGATTGIDLYSSIGLEFAGLSVTGYPIPFRADLIDYPSIGLFARRARFVPAGITSMKDLDPSNDYYASTTTFAAFTTDRPTGATGAYFITHSRANGDSVTQTITRNTSTSPVQYWRILNHVTKETSAWQQATTTAVANSAT